MAHFIVTDKIDFEEKGEDFVSSGHSVGNNFAIVCIADGVSRSEDSKLGAQIAAQSACLALMSSFENHNINPDYDEIYSKIVDDLNHRAESHFMLSNEHSHSLYATTLITGSIKDSFAQFSYVGNGAIIQIRKEWWDLPDDNLMLLGILNYLSPHIRLNDGDTPLYKALKVGQDQSGKEPDVFTLKSDTVSDSVFLLCSDGLCSAEDFSFFHHPEEGDFYRMENPRLMLFLQTLKKHKEKIKNNPDDFMVEFREAIQRENILNDDLTYALFIP